MSTASKKILITGVTGFIGSHLAQQLSAEHEVYGLVKYCTSRNLKALEPFLRDTILITGDIGDFHSIKNTLRSVDPDVVIHLAALSPVRSSFEMPFAYVHANVVGTLNLAHGMLELPDFARRKMIYASTAEVYGIQQKQPIPEDAVLNPSSPYANTKSMTDTYLRMMTKVYGLNTTVMRCTNTFGRKIDTSFFVEYLITTMLRGERVYVGAPDSLRDYMYVSDHVGAYVAALNHPEIAGEAFNVSPGPVISNRDMAFMTADLTGYNRRKIVIGKYPPNYPMRPLESDQPFIHLDAAKIQKTLGWRPKVKLADGVRRSVDHWKKALSA